MATNRKGASLDEMIAEDMKNDKFRAIVERKLAQIHLERLLARVRTKAGLSQADVAKRVGRSQPWVAAAETKSASNMQISTLARLVSASGGRLEIVVKDQGGKKVGAVQVSA